MRGHEPLITLRRRGYTPAVVWIDATGEDGLCLWRDWHRYAPPRPHIDVDPTETIARLDLRFLHGVSAVFLEIPADNPGRQLAMLDAIRAEGVRRVLVSLTDGPRVVDVIMVDAEEVAHG